MAASFSRSIPLRKSATTRSFDEATISWQASTASSPGIPTYRPLTTSVFAGAAFLPVTAEHAPPKDFLPESTSDSLPEASLLVSSDLPHPTKDRLNSRRSPTWHTAIAHSPNFTFVLCLFINYLFFSCLFGKRMFHLFLCFAFTDSGNSRMISLILLANETRPLRLKQKNFEKIDLGVRALSVISHPLGRGRTGKPSYR